MGVAGGVDSAADVSDLAEPDRVPVGCSRGGGEVIAVGVRVAAGHITSLAIEGDGAGAVVVTDLNLDLVACGFNPSRAARQVDRAGRSEGTDSLVEHDLHPRNIQRRRLLTVAQDTVAVSVVVEVDGPVGHFAGDGTAFPGSGARRGDRCDLATRVPSEGLVEAGGRGDRSGVAGFVVLVGTRLVGSDVGDRLKGVGGLGAVGVGPGLAGASAGSVVDGQARAVASGIEGVRLPERGRSIDTGSLGSARTRGRISTGLGGSPRLGQTTQAIVGIAFGLAFGVFSVGRVDDRQDIASVVIVVGEIAYSPDLIVDLDPFAGQAFGVAVLEGLLQCSLSCRVPRSGDQSILRGACSRGLR